MIKKDIIMKRALFCLMIFLAVFAQGCAFSEELNAKDIKAEAYALYNTNHINEALKLLDTLPLSAKDAEAFVIIANIYQDKGQIDKAVENLNRALLLDSEYYKAYYNLGCIFLDKKAYEIAKRNLELSIKYNKDFPYSYYNLGTLYIRLGEYEKAKKNLIKAIYLKGDEKDFYLNLAYVYKTLGKEKDAKKLLEVYNQAK